MPRAGRLLPDGALVDPELHLKWAKEYHTKLQKRIKHYEGSVNVQWRGT
jgi:hypothetical protein